MTNTYQHPYVAMGAMEVLRRLDEKAEMEKRRYLSSVRVQAVQPTGNPKCCLGLNYDECSPKFRACAKDWSKVRSHPLGNHAR